MATLRRSEPLSLTHPNLIEEWDYEKNSPLTPEQISSGSNKKVWWKCSEGHSWEAIIQSRTRGTRCPYCSGNKVISGVNDLASLYPNLAKEWDFARNETLKPSDVSSQSHQKVWWKCSLGHSWNADIGNRARGVGCPYCSNKKVLQGYNDLATINPKLSAEWNYEKNYPLKPTQVSIGTNKKVWWKCSEGHEWPAIINDRGTKQVGCPYCANRKVLVGFNDLGTARPEISKEWNYEKNGDLTPEKCTTGSRKKVWWKCSNGHEWEAKITDRSRGGGCPICSNHKVLSGYNDLATVNPELAKEWNYEKNKGLKDKDGRDISTPDKVTIYSSQSVWWRCSRGHEWKVSISSRSSGHDCPRCQHIGSSKAEQGIVYYLSQCCVVEPRAMISKQEIDVYLPDHKIGIEYDGKHWHRNKQALENKKNIILKSSGIVLFRIKESDHNCLEENVILYKYDDMGTNYEWALKSLFCIIAEIVGDEKIKTIDVNVQRDSLKIREQFSLLIKKNSLAAKYPMLSLEWNYEKNGILQPEMFYPGSSEKVWWKGKCGHEWQAKIDNRVRGAGCPYCAGTAAKPVICIETGKTYKSMTAAAKASGIKNKDLISLCCKGELETAGGFHWRFNY